VQREEATELGTLAALLRKIAATPRDTTVLAPNALLGERYEVRRFLGRGGMGAVYEVHDRELDERVALKLLHRDLGDDAGYRQRLRSEVRLARRVSHPNVCRVHDLGVTGGQLYVTMELVRGQSLRQLLRARDPASAPTLASVIDLVVQIAGALGAAHRVGVLHRDVKPDNVMVDGTRAVLTDFGVASLAHDREQVVAGTPSYIAPEVLRGEAFDHRADIYSFAVLAYELATGEPPFPARSLEHAAALAAAPRRPPPLPVALGTKPLRDALDEVFAHALHGDPDQRVASLELFAEAFAHAAREGGAQVRATRSLQGDRPARTPSTRRSEVRVATALVYRSDALPAGAGESLERIVVDAGGTPIRVSPLEVAALFGAPVALGDDAVRAATAARALIAHAGGRAGLDTVRLLIRPDVAPLASREAFASASALAGAAAAGDVLTSPVTARQLATRFETASVGGAGARRIVGHRRPRPRADAASFRARELAWLVELAHDCFRSRRPRYGEVRGPAGFGKSRLREALIARMREAREVEWLVARGDLQGNSSPLGLLRDASADWYQHVLQAGLADRRGMLVEARRWLEQRAERRPIAVVFEDLQWADEISRDVIEQLASSLEGAPVLILAFIRTGDRDTSPPPRSHVDVLELGPLETASALELVRAVAPEAARDAVEAIVARAGGHPFFLEELARELVGGGAAHGTDTPLPATVEAILQARLDALGPGCREVVAKAAVMGTTFWRDALASLLERDDESIDDDLIELERLGVVAPATNGVGRAGDRYRFVHELLRDAAYAGSAPRELRASHARISAWLAERFPMLRDLDRLPVDLDLDVVLAFAHHLEAAGEPARAAGAYRTAGMRYIEAAMYRDAARALRRAALLVPAIDSALATALGDAVLIADSIAEAEVWYERALASTPPDDDAQRARLWQKLGAAASRRADNQQALRRFEAGLALAAPDGKALASWAARDPRTAALLYGDLGWVVGYSLADNQRGLPACERAVELLEGTPYRRELAHAFSRLGATYMRASRFRDQLACNRRNLEIGLELSDAMMQLTARINLGVVHNVLGEVDQAIEHTEVARDLATRSGARNAAGVIESNLAGYYLECGRLDDVQRCLDEAQLLFERSGRRTDLTETYGFAARLRAARGDLAGAERWASQSLELAQHLELRLDHAIALRLLAQIHARHGDHTAATAAIETATARIAGIDRYEAARTEAARARVLRMARKSDEAAAARDRALAELTTLGARRELAVLDDLDEVR
jgi:tRNA A-37 threonylcarbamoyl transferase component Bud32/tetratricopeptide (TPR) repeat protein